MESLLLSLEAVLHEAELSAGLGPGALSLVKKTPTMEDLKAAMEELEKEKEKETEGADKEGRDEIGLGREGEVTTKAGGAVALGKRKDRPMVRRKSELPRDEKTVKTLGEYHRVEEFLTAQGAPDAAAGGGGAPGASPAHNPAPVPPSAANPATVGKP